MFHAFENIKVYYSFCIVATLFLTLFFLVNKQMFIDDNIFQEINIMILHGLALVAVLT